MYWLPHDDDTSLQQRNKHQEMYKYGVGQEFQNKISLTQKDSTHVNEHVLSQYFLAFSMAQHYQPLDTICLGLDARCSFQLEIVQFFSIQTDFYLYISLRHYYLDLSGRESLILNDQQHLRNIIYQNFQSSV